MSGVAVYEAENGEWAWRFQDGNNQIIAVGGETYTREDDALRGFDNAAREMAAFIERCDPL